MIDTTTPCQFCNEPWRCCNECACHVPSGRKATPLAARIAAVKDELEALQREVEALPPFLGAFHAVNGLQQARTRIADCLYRLPKGRPMPDADRKATER